MTDHMTSQTTAAAWSLEGRTALVTGAASGIGRASAETLARYGARVVVADIDLDGAQQTAATIAQHGGEVTAIQCDVTDDDSVEVAIATTIGTYGQLDIAHNNAGVLGAQRRLVDYDLDDWDRIIAVNLKGVFLCMRRELGHMVPRKSGVIINTASEAALKGSAADAVYTASKRGVAGLTLTAALENARVGVRVVAVCPGVISTGMTADLERDDSTAERTRRIQPIQRMGHPSEVGEAVAWLASDAASLVTGILLPVDGGWSAT
jgi:NAD(P)-dependent dehydrogenase (short-subunit alcohol dehydrogenase family)